ncbi:MAG: Nramp family divalent metal transporter [Acidobacteriota bacterium]
MTGPREPPQTIWGALRFVGPGFILSASVVGSGELIATTALGARAGYVLLWIILLGCLVKVAVQLEYGRITIARGLTTVQAWELSRRGRIGPWHWSNWILLCYLLAMFVGQAGVLGGAAQVLTYALPGLPVAAAGLLLAASISLIQHRGHYSTVETGALIFNGIFVAGVGYCLVAVQSSEFAFGWRELREAFHFRLPPETLELALAAFGITGIAAGEVVMYPYWCLEKGYARFAGPPEESPEWRRRARGWIRVMTLDAFVAALAYTFTTCAFYFLGAAVLSRQPELADGNALLAQLSALFTRTLGERTRAAFLLCALVVLYSTIFANTAAYSRLWADLATAVRRLRYASSAGKRRVIVLVTWGFPLGTALIYAAAQRPLFLVILMGVVNSAFLLVVAYQAVVFRYRRTAAELQPHWLYDAALWISLAAIGFVGFRSLLSLVG